MSSISLSESVIKKIQMAKLLYELAQDCFRFSENPERTGAGILLLQDSVEIFLLAMCEHKQVPLHKDLDFDKYFVELAKITNEEAPLKRQMLDLHQLRNNVKHRAILPRVEDCTKSVSKVREFFLELSDRYLCTDFDSITLIDLLDESESKQHLWIAQEDLKSGNYKECQINCRKALYLKFEKEFDIRVFEKDNYISRIAAALISKAPDSFKDIKHRIKEPTDYIVLDFRSLEQELLLQGIFPVDFWNVWRLTPTMYYYQDEKEWVIKDEFNDEIYNEQNAEYCFRKTVEIMLLNQRYSQSIKYSGIQKNKAIKTLDKTIKVFSGASSNSEVVVELNGCRNLFCFSKSRGIDDKKQYYHVLIQDKKDGQDWYNAGYIVEDDVEQLPALKFPEKK